MLLLRDGKCSIRETFCKEMRGTNIKRNSFTIYSQKIEGIHFQLNSIHFLLLTLVTYIWASHGTLDV